MRFLRAVASEWSKTWTTRLWWVLLIIMVGYVGVGAAGIGLALAVAPEETPVPLPDEMLPPVVYSMATAAGFVFPLVFGAMSVTSEVRHRTLSATFLAVPDRGAVLGAKAVVAALVGAGYGVAGLVATAGLGAAVLAATGIDPALGDPETWALFGRIVLAMAVWGVVGVGLGVLIPSQVGSIVAILAFTQFVEPLLRTAAAFVSWLSDVGRFLPGAAGDALVGASFYSAFAPPGSALEWWQGGLVLAGYAAVFLVAGGLTFWRRDVT